MNRGTDDGEKALTQRISNDDKHKGEVRRWN